MPAPETFDYELTAKPCPCGRCDKWVVHPLFYSQDASVTKAEADELVYRWNAYHRMVGAINRLAEGT